MLFLIYGVLEGLLLVFTHETMILGIMDHCMDHCIGSLLGSLHGSLLGSLQDP